MPIRSARLGGTAPGSLLSATTMPRISPSIDYGANSARVVYRSTDGSGSPTVVSGAVFVPRGQAPPGGWPVVAIGHASTGIDDSCGPSSSSVLLGRAPLVAGFLRLGYAVTLTDYQGLGAGGVHPYLDARTAGMNVIDSVRALRATFPNVSNRWAASGRDEGGAAVWSAAEQAPSRAPELHMVGAVAISPTADVTGLVDAAVAGTLTREQTPMLLWLLESLRRRHPDVDLDDYRRGVVAANWAALTACSGPITNSRNDILAHVDPHDLSPAGDDAAARLRGMLQDVALPRAPLTVPLSVVVEPDGSAVDARWTSDAINRACSLGGSVVWHPGARRGIPDVDDTSQIAWLADRFAGRPAPDYCASGITGAPDAGAVVSTAPLTNLADEIAATGARAARVVYHSTNGDTGAPTIVSGAVFVPSGAPPNGGWPAIVVAHGTTGIQQPCAPSLSPDLMGQAGAVAGPLRAGFAVAFPDYQGLGTDGVHPFPDSRTAGLNVIDAMRALRATFPGVSTRWAAIGHSQGGGAVWAANEQADRYAPELRLVGTVALAPSADVTGLVDEAAAGTLTKDQALALQWALVSLSRLHPELDLDDLRRGSAAKDWDALSGCAGADVLARESAAAELGAFDLAPATPAAADELRGLLRRWALPQRPLSAPMSVIYGSDDPLITPASITAALQRACAMGDVIAWREEPGRGHVDLGVGDQFDWLMQRFANQPAVDDCR
ncbi:lipase family protein [Mycolicibacterium madagascariense]|nr:lipase family protein [Mycolicibacterium madagascariense]